jgi:hypothetical protein
METGWELFQRSPEDKPISKYLFIPGNRKEA